MAEQWELDEIKGQLELIAARVGALNAPKVVEVSSIADAILALRNEPSTKSIRLTTGDYSQALVLPARTEPIVIDLGGSRVPQVVAETGAANIHARNLTVEGTASTLVQLGLGTETLVAETPQNITLENVIAQGNPLTGQKRGFGLHGRGLTLLNCSALSCFADGQDTQGVYINNGPGPYSIIGGLYEASGENILVGGDSVRLTDLVEPLPSDILVDGVTLSKPLAWRTTPYDVKNLFELKSGRRVTVRNSVLDGCWAANQTGYGILVTPKDQYGANPWTQVIDALFEDLTIANVGAVFNIASTGSQHPLAAVPLTGVTMRRINATTVSEFAPSLGRFATVQQSASLPVRGLVFEDIISQNHGTAVYFTGGKAPADTVFRRSTFNKGTYGVYAASFGQGSLALEPGVTWEDMRIIGASASAYPAGTIVV